MVDTTGDHGNLNLSLQGSSEAEGATESSTGQGYFPPQVKGYEDEGPLVTLHLLAGWSLTLLCEWGGDQFHWVTQLWYITNAECTCTADF